MKRMIIVTPEQFAKLQRGSERIMTEDKQREKDLTNFVKRAKSLKTTTPEQYNKFQSLFSRFVEDQRRMQTPSKFAIHEDISEEEEDEDRRRAPFNAGLSFSVGEPDLIDFERELDPFPTQPTTSKVAKAKPTLKTKKKSKLSTSFTKFVRENKARRDKASTPNLKSKKNRGDVSLDENLLNQSGKELRWRSVKLK